MHPIGRYADRGIPWRRGYLLHGVPGGGKTSLIGAIAGELDAKVFWLSLGTPGMSDQALSALLAAPQVTFGSVVVIEDIDAAFPDARLLSTRQKRQEEEEAAAQHEIEEQLETYRFGLQTQVDAGRMMPMQMEQAMRQHKTSLQAQHASSGGKAAVSVAYSTVTLAGVLNALDGLHAGEGRIVIMTTNRRDVLDPALVRPGRIDVEVPFLHTTAGQLRDLFTMFYSSYEEQDTDEGSSMGAAEAAAATTIGPLSRTRVAASDELRKNARTFAELVPAGQYTAAEIMGYMLKHDSQQSALAGAAALARGADVGAHQALVTLPNALRTGLGNGRSAGDSEDSRDVGGELAAATRPS